MQRRRHPGRHFRTRRPVDHLIEPTEHGAEARGAASAIARGLAADCGVTRFADVTGLDRIGLPVWQAVRPWSRSVSVHQGKGVDAGAARIGAAMEAIECCHAEAFAAPVLQCRFGELPASERAPDADDFAVRRNGLLVDQRLDWVAAERCRGAGRLWVPLASVSLDLTKQWPAGIAPSSNGQGAGFDDDHATLKALCELIERDAMALWAAGNIVTRLADEIDLDTVAALPGADWYRFLARCRSLGIVVRAYRVAAVIALPVIAVELHDRSGEAIAHALCGGTCAHPDPMIALRGAFLEAVQSRLTIIAGSRDDLPLGNPGLHKAVFGHALPRSSGGLDFADCWPDWPQDKGAALAAMLEALARAGYPDAVQLRLSPADCPVVSMRVLVPGLGIGDRCRRPAG